VIEPRLYRAAFVPALLILVLAAFSLESRPRPLPQGLAADVLFDGNLAGQAAAQIAERRPDRRAGTTGDLRMAEEVAAGLSSRGFHVERRRFARDGKDLVNVIGSRAGRSRRQIAIVAARDASGIPDAIGSAADTAALLEFARVFEGRPTRKTLVLASVDGSTLGDAGAEELVDELGDPQLTDAVLVMSDLASGRSRGPLIVPWSSDTRRTGIGLQRTVADSVHQELDRRVGATGVFGQLARLSFPIGIGAQGVLLANGFDAVRISGSGELPPDGPDGVKEIDQDRLGGLGRGALRTVTALDEGRAPERGPGSYVAAVSQVLPGWVIALLAVAFLLPAVIAVVDAFARARRRREPVSRWFRWLGLHLGPLLAGLLLAGLLALVGATPEPPAAPAAPEDYPLDGSAVAVLLGIAALLVILTLAGRFLALRSTPALSDRSAPGAAVAASLTTCAATLALWVLNPYACLVMLPAAHLWMLATLSDPAPPRRARAALVGLGLLPPLLVALYWLVALSVDPLSGAWYLLLLVTGGAVGLPTVLIGCVLLATLPLVVSIARSGPEEPAEEPEERPRVYGPGAYAGPGSLGGTESALGPRA
jgi:MFS family permease